MTIDEILDEMENLLLDAARIPFTNKRVIEEDEMVRLLDEIRETLPQEIKEAAKVVSDRQRILDDAQKESQHILDQAKVYVTKLTDDNVISKQAQEQANAVMLQAQKAAESLQSDAVSYADDVFTHLENNLKRALDVIQQGRNDLHNTKEK